MIAELEYKNVGIITGDGSRGFPEFAPYDAIIVSAAAPELPPDFVSQLCEGGRMMIPVGNDDSQQLQLIEKQAGEARVTFRELCRFVPLVPGMPVSL